MVVGLENRNYVEELTIPMENPTAENVLKMKIYACFHEITVSIYHRNLAHFSSL